MGLLSADAASNARLPPILPRPSSSSSMAANDEQVPPDKYPGIETVGDLVHAINETVEGGTTYQLRRLQEVAIAMLKKSNELGSEDEIREIRQLANCKDPIVNNALAENLFSKITSPPTAPKHYYNAISYWTMRTPTHISFDALAGSNGFLLRLFQKVSLDGAITEADGPLLSSIYKTMAACFKRMRAQEARMIPHPFKIAMYQFLRENISHYEGRANSGLSKLRTKLHGHRTIWLGWEVPYWAHRAKEALAGIQSDTDKWGKLLEVCPDILNFAAASTEAAATVAYWQAFPALQAAFNGALKVKSFQVDEHHIYRKHGHWEDLLLKAIDKDNSSYWQFAQKLDDFKDFSDAERDWHFLYGIARLLERVCVATDDQEVAQDAIERLRQLYQNKWGKAQQLKDRTKESLGLLAHSHRAPIREKARQELKEIGEEVIGSFPPPALPSVVTPLIMQVLDEGQDQQVRKDQQASQVQQLDNIGRQLPEVHQALQALGANLGLQLQTTEDHRLEVRQQIERVSCSSAAASQSQAQKLVERLDQLDRTHGELSFQLAHVQSEQGRIIDLLQKQGGLQRRADRGVATLRERTAPKVETRRPEDVPPGCYPGYIEREKLQKALEKRLLSPGEPITTCQGIAGVGKSSLARFVIHLETIKRRYPVRLWFQSDTQEQLEGQFKDYANYKKLINDEAGAEEAFREVIAKLEETGKPYLMYFGSVADPASLEKYRPGRKGHALVTTRSGECQDSLVIETMTEKEAVRLIGWALGDELFKKNRADIIRKLAREMDYHPFGLKQACGYIIKNQPLTVAEFLERLKSQTSAVVNWTSDSGALSKSLTTVWKRSFEQLGSSARKLLDQLAYMAPAAAIPDVLSTKMDKKKVLETLVRYGLVQRSNGRYTIHTLLQQVLISKHSGDIKHLQCATELWVNTYQHKPADRGAKEANKKLLPHGQALITHWNAIYPEKPLPESLSRIIEIEGPFMTRFWNLLKSTCDKGKLTPVKAITNKPLDRSSAITKPHRPKPFSSRTTNSFKLRSEPHRIKLFSLNLAAKRLMQAVRYLKV